ncbi:TTYH [Lepeophtheirus salmonis]|uniref:Protein tweety homolog n=1 Tax=Lepeophtheirus salmonis TaxID=72036 RepID=A0A7R8CH62_LEPSM|nr:TTYH [Lepeophtheirus salmonis]CAF2820938.1 TTYH [Lepeophtheirus salmonis]
MSLIESSSQVQTAYEPTIWAKVFHSVPHVNITGHEVDGRFNPESDVYLESLGILGSLPAGIRSALDGKKRKSRPIRCCLSFFALGCCTTLTLGFFGNHLLHKGVIELEKATKNINTIISHSQEIAHKYLLVLTDDLNDNLSHLFDGPFRKSTPQSKNEHSNLMNNADLVFYNISEAQKAMKQIQFAIHHHENPIDFKYATRWPRILEVYRWPATMALQGLFTLFCLLLFVGAIIHSRLYITISVATADFCYEPTPWVMHAIEDKVPREISAYYLQCSNDQIHPFQHLIVTSQRAVQDIGLRVRRISSIARTYYPHNDVSPYLDDLEQSSENIAKLVGDLVSSLKCDQIYRSYNTALVSICDNGLLGMILMLISSVISGLYIKVDDQDPYMPLSTIERSRSGMAPQGAVTPGPSSISMHNQSRRTPPQTPSFTNNSCNKSTVFDPLYDCRSNTYHNTLGGPTSNHRLGTLGRSTQCQKGIDYLPSTMTLGRRGPYSSLRVNGRIETTDNTPMGLNFGQYPTLSKQCKTLESSKYY